MSWVNRSVSRQKLTVKEAANQIHDEFLQDICNLYDIPYQGNWVVDSSALTKEVFDAVKKFNSDLGIEKDLLLTLAATQPWSGRDSSTFAIGNNFERSASNLGNALIKHYGGDKTDRLSELFTDTRAKMSAATREISQVHGLQAGSLPPF